MKTLVQDKLQNINMNLVGKLAFLAVIVVIFANTQIGHATIARLNLPSIPMIHSAPKLWAGIPVHEIKPLDRLTVQGITFGKTEALAVVNGVTLATGEAAWIHLANRTTLVQVESIKTDRIVVSEGKQMHTLYINN